MPKIPNDVSMHLFFRLKALGEALGHVDDEDGVLLKVYDDIQEELRIKTEALRQGKQSIKALDAEIRDLQQEFEDDRTDYLDTIRKQDQQLKVSKSQKQICLFSFSPISNKNPFVPNCALKPLKETLFVFVVSALCASWQL